MYHKIVTDDTAQTVSTSWGMCEPSSSPSLQQRARHVVGPGRGAGPDRGGGVGRQRLGGLLRAGRRLVEPRGRLTRRRSEHHRRRRHRAPRRRATSHVWNDCEGKASYAQCTTDLGQPGGGAGGGLSADYAEPAWQPVAGASTCPHMPAGSRRIRERGRRRGLLLVRGGSFEPVAPGRRDEHRRAEDRRDRRRRRTPRAPPASAISRRSS